MTAKSVEKKVKKTVKKTVAEKPKIKKTRCEEAIDAIIKMTQKCEKGTEQTEFYTFTALVKSTKFLKNFSRS